MSELAAAPPPRARAFPWAMVAPSPRQAAVGISLALVVFAILIRPLLPVDETRYLTVAWEMWRGGDWLVPHLNGQPYSHKPPLLFWLIGAVWNLVGPSELAARLVPALFYSASVWLTGLLGDRIGGRDLGDRASVVVAGFTVFGAFGSTVMFDALTTASTLVALIGWVEAAQGRSWRGFLLAAIGLGLGVLSKGPAVLVHVLPAALLAPLWAADIRPVRWYGGVAAAVLGGAAIALAWAVPAASAGGEAFGGMILWGQTAGRVVSSFDHRQPFWFFAALLPLLLLPWTVSRNLWAASRQRHTPGPRASRLPWIAALGSFVLFSLISGKQLHYLLPALPSAALIIAGLLAPPDAVPVRTEWGFVAVVAAVALALTALVIAHPATPDWPPLSWTGAAAATAGTLLVWSLRRRPEAAALATSATLLVAAHLAATGGLLANQSLGWAAEAVRGHPGAVIGWVGNYQGELGYLGRLETRVVEVAPAQARAWRAAHPDAFLLMRSDARHPRPIDPPTQERPYRSRGLALWSPRARGGEA